MFLLSVCKRMSVNDTLCQGSCPADHHCRFTDVAEAIADTVAIEINDCDTLGSLVWTSGPEVLISGQSCTSILFGCVLPNLKELGISLKPPLAAYEEFEYADDSVSSKSPFTSAWKALPPAIEHMSRLRKLRIWLDHEEPCSWSMVNERAALSPLASISNNPNLSVSINLPNCIPNGKQQIDILQKTVHRYHYPPTGAIDRSTAAYSKRTPASVWRRCSISRFWTSSLKYWK
jgi:hypothetical protein